MFKLESYITPILLSYVDKYIKNFRPEDSQVSLWGGDVSFHNLDLRLDVLEQELQLPFNLVSGHIHELLIHVPWTKLASEPINITINTIECVLKLRGSEAEGLESTNIPKEIKRKHPSHVHNKKHELTAPPGYVQNLINKIVNNISINCNNLILKYVEEDIVVSVNIKLLMFQSANATWQPAFTELIAGQLFLRKLITLSDLTVCLDKRNSSGKIEVYQEPILYRCFVEMRLLRQFQTLSSEKAMNTRLHVSCNSMEFSMTEQQVPMLMRIMNLIIALQQRQLKDESNTEVATSSYPADEVLAGTSSDAAKDTWTGWMWSYASTIFPTEEDFDSTDDSTGEHVLRNYFQLGVYIDRAIFTFKVSELYANDRGYYGARKLKYGPLLCLQLNGCYLDTIVAGREWTSVQMGIAEALLIPQGSCSCGVSDIWDKTETQYYLKTGSYNENHKKDSLFDENPTNCRERTSFLISLDHYLDAVSEAVLLEKTSAFAVDFLYHLEVPDDYNSEQLSELGSDLEYTNLIEKSICRIIGGPLAIHVCSGLIHRLGTLQEVINSYEYPPYIDQPVDPEFSELHPPSEDDFDALSNAIPTRIYQVTFLKSVIHFQLMDHPKFIATKNNLFRRSKVHFESNTDLPTKKHSGVSSSYPSYLPFVSCPSITLEYESIDIKLVIPIYPKRLVYTTCQLPIPPEQMFNACYNHVDVAITGFSSQMVFNSSKKTTILLPFDVKCVYKSIIFPKYWIDPEIIHEEILLDVDSVTFTATKAKVMVIYHIIDKLLKLDIGDSKNTIFASSVLQDASRDSGMVVLELYAEQFKWRRIYTSSTECHKISLDSLKAFVLEPNHDMFGSDSDSKSLNTHNMEPNQVLIISAPEYGDFKSNSSQAKENCLFTAIIQFPRYPDICIHPPLLIFNLEEIKMCVDPLLFQWFFYSPKYMNIRNENYRIDPISMYRTRHIADINTQDTPRRVNTPHESIHSSSERELLAQRSSSLTQSFGADATTSQLLAVENTYYDFMLKWYLVWTNIIVFGDITPCTIYFPTESLPAVGSQGIEDAITTTIQQNSSIEIMVAKLPGAKIRTCGQKQSLTAYTLHLPVTVPATVWTENKQSFPWTIEIKNLCCYTLQNKSKLYFLKPISGNITMGLSIKNKDVGVANIASTAHLEPIINVYNKGKGKKVAWQSKVNYEKPCSLKPHSIENISSVSIYVHVDNTPIELALSEIQVCLISSILHALLEVVDKLCLLPIVEEKKKIREEFSAGFVRKSHSRSQSPSYFKEEFHDSISEKTPTSLPTETKSVEDDSNEIKFTVWMQWTITRLRMKLYGYDMTNMTSNHFSYLSPPTLKLVFELEDIMTSLDLQQIYSKFKLKIVTANILHYRRKSLKTNWEPGIYLGTIMRSREELPTNEKQEEFVFMSVTITRAKCGHVHNKWGASKKHRLSEMKIEQQTQAAELVETRYISEVVATIQSMDFILSAKVLKSFCMVLEPILKISLSDPKPPAPSGTTIACFNNSNLPLAYLECNGLRIVILSSELETQFRKHDICILEIDNISLSPTAENPIVRNPVRPDIYQHAAQNRLLNIPGSDIEDRQYQFNLKSLSVNSGLWSEFSQLLSKDSGIFSSLHTMNENPALEWNNLEWGKSSLVPHLSLLPIIQKFDQCVVIAPAIKHRNNILVCGFSLELNCVSDIEIFISLHQFHLMSALLNEFLCLLTPGKVEFVENRPKFTYFNREEPINKYDLEPLDYFRDSGVETMDVNSEITIKTRESANRDGNRRNLLKQTSESKSSDISHCAARCSTSVISPTQLSCNCPVEILITAGQITVSLYKITKGAVTEINNTKSPASKSTTDDDTGYDASEEESLDIPTRKSQKIQPLLFLLLAQPNLLISDVAFDKKINFSCFDVQIKTNESKRIFVEKFPTPKDYQVFLMETKPGIPYPDSGIPPAFISVKWLTSLGKNPALEVDFGRPVRIFYSREKLNHLLYLKEHVLQNFNNTCNNFAPKNSNVHKMPVVSTTTESKLKYSSIKNMFNGVNKFNLKFSQLVFVFRTPKEMEMTFSIENLESRLSFLSRPERVLDILSVNNVAISTKVTDSNRFLLNPWSCTIKTVLQWESWQAVNSDPQIQMSVNSDCFNLDIGPEQIKCIEAVIEECNELKSIFKSSEIKDDKAMNNQVADDYLLGPSFGKDQYYKDDLRAGAFQFVSASGDCNDLPLPYQVMFWEDCIHAMAWRYPQPRVLTKVRVTPLPYKPGTNETSKLQVLCFLEYWSECHGYYKSFAEFHLSETEMFCLEIPKSEPQTAVSCIWRVVLSFSENQSQNVSVRALAGCLRIDSYFNSAIIPKFQISANCFSINVCLFNQFNKKLALIMPEKLRYYTPDGLIPDNQCFLIFKAEYTEFYIACWHLDITAIDFKSNFKCCVLDYSTLTLQPFLEPVYLTIRLNLLDSVNISLLAERFEIKMGPSIGHTLAVSSQLWAQSWLPTRSSIEVELPDMVIITRYVICNDTNIKLRFGQTNTEEDILLPSRFLHLYCWRSQKCPRAIKIGMERNGWVWSKSITIDDDKSESVKFVKGEHVNVIVTVKSLSATQKQIIFSGELVICNMLLDQFELKVISLAAVNKDTELRNADSHIINGKSTAPSILINSDSSKKLALRVRFLNLESAWSGDIPLEENVKCSQPWLVKVPLQERGQFLSIWCRIIEKRTLHNRKLVMLWPLFMVRSYLPVVTKINIHTPALNVHLESVIRGRAELQQLYCPGTIDHSHNLTFDYGELPKDAEPYIPLNYSLIDHQEIFKKIDQNDVTEILDYLKTYDESKWPYVDNSIEYSDWCIDEQPITNVQVRYQSPCKYSSSLLVELLPWCLVINTLGIPISIIIKGNEYCKISHYGVVTPPRLENTFHIAVGSLKQRCISPLLQLAKVDQSFYMPKINGVIPLEGNIQIPVKRDNQMCQMSITSTIMNELRVIQVSPSYIITNHTNLPLKIICVAVPKNRTYKTSQFIHFRSVLVESTIENRSTGVPIIWWNCMEEVLDSISDLNFYVIVTSVNKNSSSFPLQVNKGAFTKSICLYSNFESIPLTVISQENKGLTYLSVHHDIHPQLLIQNKSPEILFCAQCDANGSAVKESDYIQWMCYINPNTETYYTMPSVSINFPNVNESIPDKLLLSVTPEDSTGVHQWSHEINIGIFNEQYVRIPHCGDLKLTIKRISYCVLIIIDSVSEVEISAQDIRSRLLLQSTDAALPSSSESKSVRKIRSHSSTKNTRSPIYFESDFDQEESLRPANTITTLASSESDFTLTSSLNSRSETNTHWLNFKTRDTANRWSTCKIYTIVRHVVFSLVMDDDNDKRFEKSNLSTLACDFVAVTLDKTEAINASISIANIQLDNKLYHTGRYDFPVVLIGGNFTRINVDIFNTSIIKLIQEIKATADVNIDTRIEMWYDKHLKENITEMRDVKIQLQSLSLYIEDTYITKVINYLNNFSLTRVAMWSLPKHPKSLFMHLGLVGVPEHLKWEAKILSRPLYLQNLSIESLSLLLSLHSSVKLYIALDRSPLQFKAFERKNIMTNSYRLGNALAVHYLSGAIFAAGWAVGSLELLGSPSGLARTLGSGLRDFVSLPYNGLIQGPWAFLVGITHGSASLMRHVTAGTLDSVTKLAASVARNLDRLTLDEEHQRRTEELRRQRPQGIAEGFMQGLTGLGISLLGAVGGIAHHPLQSVMNGGTTRSLVTGVGLGLVGVITKPLSGAAELVALTGQGLLQGAGWNPLPEPRLSLHTMNTCGVNDSVLKYKWKFLQNTTLHGNLIAISDGIYDNSRVVLIVTYEAIIMIDINEDVIRKIIAVTEIHNIQTNDASEIRISLVPAPRRVVQNVEPYEIEMDPVSRARVADYVKNAAGLVQMSPLQSTSNSEDGSQGPSNQITPVTVSTVATQPCLVIYVDPNIRTYLYDMLVLVKQQNQNNTFKIL